MSEQAVPAICNSPIECWDSSCSPISTGHRDSATLQAAGINATADAKVHLHYGVKGDWVLQQCKDWADT